MVAASRGAITSGDEDGNAFRDGLLIGRVVGGVSGCAVDRLTLAVTDAHDGGRRSARVDEVLDCDQAAEGGAGVCTRGHFDGCAWGGGAGPFGVADGFRPSRRTRAG